MIRRSIALAIFTVLVFYLGYQIAWRPSLREDLWGDDPWKNLILFGVLIVALAVFSFVLFATGESWLWKFVAFVLGATAPILALVFGNIDWSQIGLWALIAVGFIVFVGLILSPSLGSRRAVGQETAARVRARVSRAA